jgi:hypothetical protein
MLAAMDDRRDRFAELNERARRAFLEGAAEEWTRMHGRPPTVDELDRLLRRYPGDPMVTEDGQPDRH